MKTEKLSTNYTIEGDNNVSVIAEVFEDTYKDRVKKKRITIHKLQMDRYNEKGFVFEKSTPNTIRQIGELLVGASKLI